MSDFYIKKGDTLPVLRLEMKDTNGNPINLTGTSISFQYRLKKANSTLVTQTAVIEDAINGIANYPWTTADSAVAGVYMAEFVISFPNGSVMSFPQDSFLVFEVEEDVG